MWLSSSEPSNGEDGRVTTGAIVSATWEPLESGSSKGRVVSVMAICVSVKDVQKPWDLEELGLVVG